MASKMYPFINYRDSIHYRNSCSATIVIVKFLLSLSTSSRTSIVHVILFQLDRCPRDQFLKSNNQYNIIIVLTTTHTVQLKGSFKHVGHAHVCLYNFTCKISYPLKCVRDIVHVTGIRLRAILAS